MVNTSFKDQFELLSKPLWALPQKPTMMNFRTVIQNNFFGYFKNSFVIVITSVIVLVFVSAMASYIFARMKIKSIHYMYLFIISGMAIPIHITLIPIYDLTQRLKIYDKLFALMGPYVALSLPMSIFILTEFMRDIPKDIEEAARIDGCSYFSMFFKIILPLSTPGIVTITIYNGTYLWNEFIFALVLTSSPQNRTLPLSIWDYQGQYAANIPNIMALLTLSILPMVIVYVLGQEKIIKGMMAGAVKG